MAPKNRPWPVSYTHLDVYKRQGIISAKDRVISIDGEHMTLLQTNAAVNPGNSGGGLFDAQARLVGVVLSLIHI